MQSWPRKKRISCQKIRDSLETAWVRRNYRRSHSRSQSLRSPWPAVGNEGLWKQPFQAWAKMQTAETGWAELGYFLCYFKMVSSRVSRVPTAGQGKRRLWERDLEDRGYDIVFIPLGDGTWYIQITRNTAKGNCSVPWWKKTLWTLTVFPYWN